jgi:hypothetical protein
MTDRVRELWDSIKQVAAGAKPRSEVWQLTKLEREHWSLWTEPGCRDRRPASIAISMTTFPSRSRRNGSYVSEANQRRHEARCPRR